MFFFKITWEALYLSAPGWFSGERLRFLSSDRWSASDALGQGMSSPTHFEVRSREPSQELK